VNTITTLLLALGWIRKDTAAEEDGSFRRQVFRPPIYFHVMISRPSTASASSRAREAGILIILSIIILSSIIIIIIIIIIDH